MRLPFRSSLEPWLDAPLSYDEVGGTADDPLPAGYHHVHRSLPLGEGRPVFEAATRALWAWDVHRAAGLHVMATGPGSMVGAVVVSTLGLGRFGFSIPCRVVDVVDEPDRRGFVYGTLAGHPEQGEERFVISIAADQTVTFDITAFSRQATFLARVGSPAARVVQSFYTGRYLTGARRLGREGS